MWGLDKADQADRKGCDGRGEALREAKENVGALRVFFRGAGERLTRKKECHLRRVRCMSIAVLRR